MINNPVLLKHHFRIWRIINMIVVVIDVIIPWGLLTKICRDGGFCSAWFSPGTLASQVLVTEAYLVLADISMFALIVLLIYYSLLNFMSLFFRKNTTWNHLLAISLLIIAMSVFLTFSFFSNIPAVLDISMAGYWVLLLGLFSGGLLELLQYQTVHQRLGN